MKILEYNGSRRSETDEGVIEILVRKGWVDVTPPEKPTPPEYNPDIESLEYDGETNSYDKIPHSEEVLAKINLMKVRRNISQKISNGFLVEPENFVIGLEEQDRTMFSQMLSLVKEALDLGLITNDTVQTISDKDGQKHEITTLRFRKIMVQYGFYYKGL